MNKFITIILLIGIVFTAVSCSNENIISNKGTDTKNKHIDDTSAQKTSSEITSAEQLSTQDYFVETKGDRPFGVAFHDGIMYMVTAPASGVGKLWKINPDRELQQFAKLEGDFKGNYLTDKSFVSAGIDFDKNSNVFITLGDRVIKISPDGEVSTIADGFSRCFDIKLDLKGNMYIADDKEDTIYLLSPSMEKSIFYKGKEHSNFVLTSLAFDKDYTCLYAREGKKILKFNVNNNVVEEPEVIVDNVNIFNICIDSNNNIYASTDSSIIKKIDSNGQVTDIAKQGLIHDSIGLNIGGTGFDTNSLYIADTGGIIKVPFRK